MKKTVTLWLTSLLISATAHAASVNVALDANPNREQSGTYRYVDNLLTNLKKVGWDTETFPRDTIGGENDRLDQVRAGILDISMSDFSIATQFVPELQVLQLPYTFKDPKSELNFFTKSDYLETVNKKLANEGMRILAIAPNGGFLGIFNSKKPVKTVTDMKGLRFRAMDENQLTMFKLMGANGVVIPFSEVPNAIQTGIADGYINASSVPLTFGQQDLFKYFTNAKVIISARLVLASDSWWNDLSDSEKKQFNQASAAAQQEVFDWVDKSEDKHMQELQAAGIQVYQPTDAELATYKTATENMTKQITDVPAKRIAQIRKLVDQYSN
ncbi:hypothetical protein F9817_21120 [Vibrio sp. CAIM 722]|uniref:Uncharacterized protein n=1 Tax=Vibrio eleionomae TaxID=2653505 RepID=A0A7X4LPH0_9VIBR|nr:TRAP transporter substrate-binding protein [Vibrio eleionomae]MZI95687.1 hypothetical protein [Vibrio eleionomae]